MLNVAAAGAATVVLAACYGSVGYDSGFIDDTATGLTELVDNDGDGFYSAEDCDDEDAAINPDAAEDCTDLIDNDCDDLIDGDDDECPTS
jgi:hypothetical protein